jgi:hypothetical protein
MYEAFFNKLYSPSSNTNISFCFFNPKSCFNLEKLIEKHKIENKSLINSIKKFIDAELKDILPFSSQKCTKIA